MEKQHQIQKLSFDISISDEHEAQERLQSIQNLINRRLLDTIQNVLDEFNIELPTFEIDQLTINLGDISIYNIDSELEYKLRTVLRDQIQILINETEFNYDTQENSRYSQESKKQQEWLVSYLKTGTLPWWKNANELSHTSIAQSLDIWLNEQPQSLKALLENTLQHPQFEKRLRKLKSARFIEEIIGFNTQELEAFISYFTNKLNAYKITIQNFYVQLWAATIKRSTHEKVKKTIESVVTEELINLIQKELKLSISEALILLKSITKDQPYPPIPLQRSIENSVQQNLNTYSPLTLLSSHFKEWINKPLLLLGELVDQNDFEKLATSKAYKAKLFNQLSIKQIEQALSLLYPEKIRWIEKVNQWQLFLTKKLAIQPTNKSYFLIQNYLELINSLINAGSEKKKEMLLYKKTIEHASSILSISPVTTIELLNLDEIIRPSSFNKTVKNLEVEIQQDLRSNAKSKKDIALSEDWIEEFIEYLITGVIQQSNKIDKVSWKSKFFLAAEYLLGAQLNSLNWEKSSIKIEQLENFTWKSFKHYQNSLQAKLKDKPLLQLSLVRDRINNLALTDAKKKEILKIGLTAHSSAKLLLDPTKNDLIGWLQESKNLSFSLSYLLQFNRLPFSAAHVSSNFFIQWIHLQSSQKEIAKVIEALSVKEWTQFREKLKASLEDLNLVGEKRIILLKSWLEEAKPANQIVKSSELDLSTLKKLLQTTVLEFDKFIDQQIALIKKNRPDEQLKNDLIEYEKEKANLQSKLSESLERMSEELLEQALYVQNAGIVLLGPYLPRLFEKLSLLDEEGQFKDENTKVKAVELIHFLSFGTEEMMDYTTVLNKLLVSMPISTALDSQISLSGEEKELCESLLKGVIQNWKMLGNSSIDNLRGTFLIREGKLNKHQEKYIIRVEEKGFDMLIDKVPWSFKLIKYKWMKKPLFVEWRA